jgi:hypothetical protein
MHAGLGMLLPDPLSKAARGACSHLDSIAAVLAFDGGNVDRRAIGFPGKELVDDHRFAQPPRAREGKVRVRRRSA